MRCTASFGILLLFLASAQADQSPATKPALPLISIASKTAPVSDTYTPCQISSADAAPAEAGFRIRGATSQGYPKKSFALSFEKPVTFADLPPRKNWILNAAYIDRSFMRHKLAYDLFRSLSTPENPRHAVASRFVEVRLNAQDQGLYLLMERIDPELLGLAPRDKHDGPFIYKADSHDAGFVHPNGAGFSQSYPDPTTRPAMAPLEQFMKHVVTSSDARLFGDIAARLDLDNAIDFHLLVLLTANADGITKNFILAQPASPPEKPAPFFFVPWDYDGSFGQNWNSAPLPPELWLSNAFFDRLRKNPEYRARYAARWKELRKGPFADQTILDRVDANTRLIAPAAKRNAALWPTNKPPYHGQLSFDDDVALIKAWIPKRTAWLDKTLSRPN